MYFFITSSDGFRTPKFIDKSYNTFCRDDCLKELNDGEAAAAVFCDISKAFNCVDHGILLCKMEVYGFRSVSLPWFASYLSQRVQTVVVGNEEAQLQEIKSGVFRGSVLGPLLFLIYVNDLATTRRYNGMLQDGKLQCKCGEDTALFDWSWQNDNSSNVTISGAAREVLFHPVYSSGTAAVRGNTPFQQNFHYYWEIKMISKLYGTDVMIGVGTSKITLSDWRFKFCSLLGIDSESWGYSYHGYIQHNKLRRKYGTKFGLGSIIGVHLDMCSGTLEYFLNRKSLGIGFKGLKGKELYPMVCSTAAQSAIRITCCMSKESTLQMLCLKNIMKHSKLFNQYRNIPGLTRIYDKQYFWMQPQPESDEKKRLAELDDDVALSLVDGSYINKSKKFKSNRLLALLYDEELENDGNCNEIYNFGDTSDSSDDSHNFNGSDSDLASEISKDVDNDSPSTSEGTHRGDFNFSCKLCGGTHKCKDCILRKQLQGEDSSSDSSEPTLIL